MLVNIAKMLFTSPNPHPIKKKKKPMKNFQKKKQNRQYESFLRCFAKGKVHRKSPWENGTLFIFLLDTQPVGWAGLCVYRKWPWSELCAEQVKCGWIIDLPWESEPSKVFPALLLCQQELSAASSLQLQVEPLGSPLQHSPRSPHPSGLLCWHR